MATAVTELPFVTRILRPRRRRNTIRRERLEDSLQRALDHRVVCVWGPAGYGKTTVLADLAERSDVPFGWYSLTPDDRNPATFVRSVARSLELAFGDGTTLLGPEMKRTTARNWRTRLGELITALHERQGETNVVLVFDDLHHVGASEEIEESLCLLIDRAPDGVRFVLASRTKPALSILPRLVVEDDVRFFGVEDLRFSPDETYALLSAQQDRVVTRAEADLAHDRVSGWPAAISLLARAANPSESPTDPGDGATKGALFEYLAQEVMRGLSDEDRDFLARSSVLSEFTARTCDELLGITDSEARIPGLIEDGFFIEECPSAEPKFRYQDLFRESLQSVLKRDDPSTYRRLHTEAAAIAERNADIDGALSHLLSADRVSEAEALMLREADDYLERGKTLVLADWISKLSSNGTANETAGNAELLLLRARVEVGTGRPTDAAATLEELLRIIGANEGLVEGRAQTVKSLVSRRLGNLDAAAEAAHLAIQRLADAGVAGNDEAEARRQLASVHGTRGDFRAAGDEFERALSLAPESNLRLISLIHDGLSAVHGELGELDEAAVHLEKARQGWLALGNDTALSETLNNLGMVYYYRGEFEIAADELAEAERRAESGGIPRLIATAQISQGLVHHAGRDHEAAITSLLAGLQRAREILDHRLVAEATNGLGRAYRGMGQIGKSETLLEQAIVEAEQSGQRHFEARYRVSISDVYCQKGDFDRALKVIEPAAAIFVDQGSPRGVAEVVLRRGTALYRLGRTQDALSSMMELARLLEELGYVGFLVPDAEQAIDLIRLAVAKGIGSEPLTGLARRLEATPEVAETTTRSDRTVGLPTVTVCGLGQAEVRLGDHLVNDKEWRSRKARELLFFLLCEGQPASKDRIIEALWPESVGNHDDALRMNVYRLRRAVFPEIIRSAGDGYSLNPDVSVEFDVARFDEFLFDARNHPKGSDSRIEALSAAGELYRGSFLEESYSTWAEDRRRTLEQSYGSAVMELAEHARGRGDLKRAITLAERLLVTDPSDEAAQLLTARCYLESGEHLLALRRIKEYMRFAREEMQTEPSTEFLDLYRNAMSERPLVPASP